MSNYLYNGIELPALPEWGAELPYLTMTTSVGGYTVAASSVPMAWHDTAQCYEILDATIQQAHCESTDGATWHVYDIGYNSYFRTYSTESLVWANYDIVLEDGSTLAASDPVPVPDEPESVLAWQKHDAYKPNTKWDGNTFYRVMGGKWVKQDAMNPSFVEVEPDVPTEVVIEWDGDITGKVTAQSGTFNLVKVSDLTPTYNDLVGAVITAGTETITITEEMLGVSPQDVFVSVIGGMFVSVYDFGIDLPFTELGFYANIEVGAFKLTYTPKS